MITDSSFTFVTSTKTTAQHSGNVDTGVRRRRQACKVCSWSQDIYRQRHVHEDPCVMDRVQLFHNSASHMQHPSFCQPTFSTVFYLAGSLTTRLRQCYTQRHHKVSDEGCLYLPKSTEKCRKVRKSTENHRKVGILDFIFTENYQKLKSRAN